MTFSAGTRLGAYENRRAPWRRRAWERFTAPATPVSADGKPFLVNTAGEATAESPLTVVTSWPAGVKR